MSSCARQGQAVLSLCWKLGNEPFPALCSVQGELCARQLPLSCSAPASFPHALGPSLPDVRILGQQAERSAKLKSSSQAWRCPQLTPPFSHPPRHPGCVCAQPGLQGASSSSSSSRSTACPRWEPRGPGESWVFPKIWSQLPKTCLSRCVRAAPLPARARAPHAHGVSPPGGALRLSGIRSPQARLREAGSTGRASPAPQPLTGQETSFCTAQPAPCSGRGAALGRQREGAEPTAHGREQEEAERRSRRV